MKRVRVKLADLFRSKASEEQADQSTETTTTDESTADETTTEEADSEETAEDVTTEDTTTEGETTTEETTTPEASEDVLVGADEVVISAADARTLRADAGNWNQHKAELETLRNWKASMDGISGGLGKEDQSTRNRSGASIMDNPWNQAAVKAAEKVK